MDEDRAAAYYDELSRKGEGAARFKRGLGFSSDDPPAKPSSSNSSGLSGFVRPSPTAAKDGVLASVIDKLRSKNLPPEDRREHRSRHRRERSRSRERYGNRRRSRSPRRRRSRSPGRRERGRGNGDGRKVDYPRLIEGYDKMTPAERVKAKMQLQLSKTAAEDTTRGMSTGWERFEFNKDAPLDDAYDDEVEVADDDASLVKNIGKSFRFSSLESKREDELKAAHDEAMFGSSRLVLSQTDTTEPETIDNDGENKEDAGSSLISDKVLALQQESWRDRARKLRNGNQS